MLFFAEDLGVSQAGWATIVAMILASFGAVVTAVLSYLAARDKSRFDARMIQMEVVVRECEEDRSECRQRVDVLQASHDTLRTEAEKAGHERARMEGQQHAMEREIGELRSEVSELRDRLYGRSKPA